MFYEAPHRLGEALADLAEALGPRPAALARELTKRFEEVVRGRPARTGGALSPETPPRGRDDAGGRPGPERGRRRRKPIWRRCSGRALRGAALKQAVAEVTAATGLPRRVVYARALALDGR